MKKDFDKIKQDIRDNYSTHSDWMLTSKHHISGSTLYRLLDELKIKRHSKKENSELTCLFKYDVRTPMLTPEIQQHYRDLFGPTGSPFSNKEIRDKRDQTLLEKYGVVNSFQIEEVKAKIKSVQIERYGGMGTMSSYQKDMFAKYMYDNTYFDSSWELAFYIYHKDLNHDIDRSPTKINYTYNNNVYSYIPDFRLDDQLIEIKGDHLIDQDGIIKSPHFERDRDIAKTNCLVQNNVKILVYNDVKVCLDYVNTKYGKHFLAKCKLSGGSNEKSLDVECS